MLPRPLPKASAIWLGIIGGAAALDYWCDLGDPDQDRPSATAGGVLSLPQKIHLR